MATLPTYTAPTYKDTGTYTAPTWNEGAIDSLTQKKAATGLRALRQSVNRVTGANYDNPNVKRMTLRDALAGYGTGIGTTLSAASAAATGEYGTKYGYAVTNAKTKYESEANAANAYNTLAQDTAEKQYEGSLVGYETEVGKETAATAAATAAGVAKTRYGYETDAAKIAAETAAKAAETGYGYSTASAKTAAETAATAAETAATAAKTALKDTYAQWKEKYLWTAEQEEEAGTTSTGTTSTGTKSKSHGLWNRDASGRYYKIRNGIKVYPSTTGDKDANGVLLS